MPRSRAVTYALVTASFLVVAILQSWPLPLHLSDRLTGDLGGDTGVYVWNTWVFRHELLAPPHWPFATSLILALSGPADLSLHNYSVFSDILSLPLQPLLGVVAAFNVVYLVNVALAGVGMFLLALHVGRGAIGRGEAWLAGLLFACSPFLVARSTAHFSLAAAAPLPFFVFWFDRAWHSRRPLDAGLAGVSVAWAGYCDPYYAIYCVVLGGCVAAGGLLDVKTAESPSPARTRLRWLDLGIGTVAAVMVVVHLLGVRLLTIGPITISMRSDYTPMLILTVLVVLRVLVTLQPRIVWTRPTELGRLVGAAIVLAGVAACLLAPLLYALAARTVDGRMVTAPVLWRSSAPGLDLAAFFVPNPNHPLAPDALVQWVSRQPGRYEGNVASIPWTVLAAIAFSWRVIRRPPNRLWLTIAVGTAALAVGPFLRIAGFETFIPTPWALGRYLPIVGEARMPARFAVIVTMAVAVLFSGALAAIVARAPGRRRLVLTLVGLVLALELLPAPRTLHSARIPAVYETIALDPRPVRVMDLPFGIRDGLSSLGDFSAASQFYQTRHGKPIIGGYLSRVSQARKDAYLGHPYTLALMQLSEGRTLDPAKRTAAEAAAARFVNDTRLGYVVIDHDRVGPDFRQFAIETLELTLVEHDGPAHLYATRLTQ